MIRISNSGLEIILCEPRTYYKGTRFDASGVFRSISKDGVMYADEWFDTPDSFRHDNVCGPSEEYFGVYGYEEAPVGGTFLKLGVGLLRKENDEPYDWFHLYEIVDGGSFSVETTASSVQYTHIVEGAFKCEKKIELLSGDSFRIVHRITNLGSKSLEINNYCHNFYTFDGALVGPSRSIEFPAEPYGDWRADSLHGYLEGKFLKFDGSIAKGEKAYIGNLQTKPAMNAYSFVLRESDKSVEVTCDQPLHHMVMWSNHRVACPEPYVQLNPAPGASASWSTVYKLK